jgi:hypothetical protein
MVEDGLVKAGTVELLIVLGGRAEDSEEADSWERAR